MEHESAALYGPRLGTPETTEYTLTAIDNGTIINEQILSDLTCTPLAQGTDNPDYADMAGLMFL